jgi:uncharacterized RDD family membrane protein YckC
MILVTDQRLVLTPEKVVVSLNYASLGSRIGAFFIDVIILISALFLLAFVALFATGFSASEIPFLAYVIVASFSPFLYFGLSEIISRGRSLGKTMVGIRVMMLDGTPETVPAAIYRALLIPADLLPGFFLAGIIAIFTNPHSQRLGDLAAGTIVIHDPKPKFQFRPSPHRYGLHPFEHAVGELPKMSLEEYYAIKRLCDRFPELPPSVQVRSVAEIWTPFAEKYNIVPIQNVHPVYQMEAVVMRYGRAHNLV